MRVRSGRLAILRTYPPSYCYLGGPPAGESWEVQHISMHNSYNPADTATLGVLLAGGPEACDLVQVSGLAGGDSQSFETYAVLRPGDQLYCNFYIGWAIDVYVCGLIYAYPDLGGL